ncbi:MAG: tetratricopeptide repeat protein [Alistipes sp.]|nr:tetratricopeptide repeat protein [Alistipes sp.]
MKQKSLHIIFTVLALLCVTTLSAQKMPERGLVRKGNRLFDKERYTQSADAYQHALNHDSTSFEARYNLGNTMIRRAMADTTAYADPQSSAAKMSQGFISQAEGLLQAAAADSLRTADERADAFYNLGNSQFIQQKLQDALKSYRQSLVLRPDDMEAKYNYALTKKLLEQQQQQQDQQNNDQNQDQQQDENQDQNQQGDNDQNQNQDKNDQSDNKQDKNEDQQGGGDNEQKEQPQQPQGQKPKSGMSEEQQQQLLNAIQAQEDKTQEKLDEKKKGIIIRGKKNW